MIDGIGKAGSGRLELVRGSVERSEAPARSGGASPERQVAQASNPAAEMAASGPPVDNSKVAAIRAAIAEGRYPVDHGRIADAMLALDLPERDGE